MSGDNYQAYFCCNKWTVTVFQGTNNLLTILCGQCSHSHRQGKQWQQRQSRVKPSKKGARSPLPSKTVPYAMQNRNFIISSSTSNLRSSHTAKRIMEVRTWPNAHKPLKPSIQGKKCMFVMPTSKRSYDYQTMPLRSP